jgi:hypothetical protein
MGCCLLEQSSMGLSELFNALTITSTYDGDGKDDAKAKEEDPSIGLTQRMTAFTKVVKGFVSISIISSSSIFSSFHPPSHLHRHLLIVK